MQRGIIGVPVQDYDRFSTVEPFHASKVEYGQTLHAAIDPEEQRTLSGSTRFIQGSALKEEIDEETIYVYKEDVGIDTTTRHTKTQNASEFVAVPGDEDRQGFAMVASSDGVFAFTVLGRADNTVMDRAEIDLGDFYLDREDDFTIQTGGQQGSLGEVDTLMAWGNELEADDNIGRSLHEAARANLLPQLAGTYVSDVIDVPVRVNLAASGYVEVWEPDLSVYDFLHWVRADILPYVRGADAEDVDTSEKADADPDQGGLGEFGGADDAE